MNLVKSSGILFNELFRVMITRRENKSTISSKWKRM